MLRGVINGFKTAWVGLFLTIKHMFASNKQRVVESVKSDNYFEQQNGHGTNTIQYPSQQLPVPEVGRYQLDVEIDDCIVCDLCAKICPVDCITIESIKATELIGLTSDGSPKRIHAAKFDIDMAKCMYCGLCTVVCPTECIVMTNEYDVSVPSIDLLNYKFSDMSPEFAREKQRELDAQLAEKQAAKLAAQKKKEDDDKRKKDNEGGEAGVVL
ncbi:formate hydrogenlyase subunit 6/NADH:ubiquinone oxidoreductase subunit I [Mucilaginibacter gracilis]|uniref:Formate hydrogenlyase subunit 6/NADH:ubiquinone oxidoreductase subunit I n=2 Tax=Mucilaginibacter gracilis TaxID=423350 RepID=A0A495J1C9_9SPHI|nr:formate hydrogenlyase subunit 6/NADH:ubiquinone oxidoreductase subunit I [Mucilaginibacter gracilis]